jgi:hypothetical protein
MSKESKYDDSDEWVLDDEWYDYNDEKKDTVRAESEDKDALKLIKEQQELEKDYIILENCQSENFIKELYKILIEHDNCFLEGAFVISDNEGKLFDKLTKTCTPNNYRPSFGKLITHDIFLNDSKFNKLKENKTRLDSIFLRNKLLYFPNAYLFKYFQYENPIKDVTGKEIEMTYLCDPECNKNEKNERCIPSRKSLKRVMLFYPFQTIDLMNRYIHRYLYIKLESSKVISMQHAKEAFVAYTNPATTSDSGYPFRRERLRNSTEEVYKNPLRISDANFYNKFRDIINVDEIRYYNNNVRSNDELYVPQALTNKILSKLK